MFKLRYKESDIQKQIMEYLRWKKIFCWRNNSGRIKIGKFGEKERWMQIGMKGLPDIMAVLKGGRLFGIEVKSHDGKLTKIQEDTINQLREIGALCIVARCIEDVEKELKQNRSRGSDKRKWQDELNYN